MKIQILNKDQKALLQWITAGLNIQEIKDLHGDAKYLLNNMIAKFSLASDYYLISCKVLHKLEELSIDLSLEYTRNYFYGKDKPFIYEHTIPTSIVRYKLLELNNPNLNDVKEILLRSGPVAMILREEDKILTDFKLGSKMPDNWNWNDDFNARYNAVGIQLSDKKLLVKGKIKR